MTTPPNQGFRSDRHPPVIGNAGMQFQYPCNSLEGPPDTLVDANPTRHTLAREIAERIRALGAYVIGGLGKARSIRHRHLGTDSSTRCPR